jgi:hypothetical protein
MGCLYSTTSPADQLGVHSPSVIILSMRIEFAIEPHPGLQTPGNYADPAGQARLRENAARPHDAAVRQ